MISESVANNNLLSFLTVLKIVQPHKHDIEIGHYSVEVRAEILRLRKYTASKNIHKDGKHSTLNVRQEDLFLKWSYQKPIGNNMFFQHDNTCLSPQILCTSQTCSYAIKVIESMVHGYH